jgi:tripartite-type tricarboxylate transporter receptor subunit TctC
VSSTYATLPLIVKDAAYDPVKDFDPVSLLHKRSSMLCVTNAFPAKNLKEFVAYAKANPGAVNFATGGAGGTQHLQGLMLELATGASLTYVHYKSIGSSYPDVMAGRTQMVPLTFGLALPMVKTGKLRALAVSARERNPALPDLPTAIEQGINWEYASWLGLITPAGTPAPLVNKVQGALARIIKDPEVQKKFGEEYTLLASTPAELKRYYTSETERWRKLAADTGIELSAN